MRGGFYKFVAILLTAAFCAVGANAAVKYVFLFIGDGMSVPQRMMTEEFSREVNGGGLYINSMPFQAITTTRAFDSFITDSAASGTAIACGTKTRNGRLGVDADGKKLVSVAEVARDSGKKVGIITSVTLNHATPAAFYAHNDNRGNAYEIALDMLESGFDFFGGGGLDGRNNKDSKSYKGEIYDVAQKEYGYAFAENMGLASLEKGKKAIAVRQKDGAMPYAIDDDSSPTLADYTQKGIELLDNPKGFFMMVEGGKIDWMCHANDAATTLRDVIEFDKAVKVAYEFAKKHPKETLIVVTGDHETGGLTLGFAGTGYQSFISRLAVQTCSFDTFKHRLGELAKSRGEEFSFEDAKPLLTECFGFYFGDDRDNPMRVRSAEKKQLEEAFDRQFKGENRSHSAFAVTALKCFNNKASIGWTSDAHTALPVITSAYGAGAETFSGAIDNTDISKKLKKLVK